MRIHADDFLLFVHVQDPQLVELVQLGSDRAPMQSSHPKIFLLVERPWHVAALSKAQDEADDLDLPLRQIERDERREYPIGYAGKVNLHGFGCLADFLCASVPESSRR